MSQTGTIGIVGGGQLARMLTEAALPMGFKVVVLNPQPDSPAAQVGASEIIGDLYDEGCLRQLAAQADYLTIEIEHLDAGVLKQLAASGKAVQPSPATLATIQDKLAQKRFLQGHGLPVAEFIEVNDRASAETALRKFGGKMLLKTRYGAYDGRGNAVVDSVNELQKALDGFGDQSLYAEKFIPFAKELAMMVARDGRGKVVCYPLTETLHERNICIKTLTPAEVTSDAADKAKAVVTGIAEHLECAGVFGIELFLTDDGNILINEIAPRVHNSGHYTIEACQTSQFEQHVRAITGLELGPTALKVPAAVMVNILGERNGPADPQGVDKAQALPHTYVHLYGKSPTKVDRKMGHLTVTADSLAEAQATAEKARSFITI